MNKLILYHFKRDLRLHDNACNNLNQLLAGVKLVFGVAPLKVKRSTDNKVSKRYGIFTICCYSTGF